MQHRFLTAHCHLGSFSVPWDPTEWTPCPLCGEDFTREHLVWECRGVTQERERLLGGVGAARVGDWTWLARVSRFSVGEIHSWGHRSVGVCSGRFEGVSGGFLRLGRLLFSGWRLPCSCDVWVWVFCTEFLL